MKKIYLLLVLVCFSLMAFAGGPDFQDGNLYYKLVDNTECYVYGLVKRGPKKLIVPSTVTISGRTLKVTGVWGKSPSGPYYSTPCMYPGVKEIVLPQTITYIGAYAFHGDSIESIVMDGVKEIQEYAFAGCRFLRKVSCMHVEELDRSCFAGCYSLEKIVIPPSCWLIGTDAFNVCGTNTNNFTIIIEDSNTPIVCLDRYLGTWGKKIYVGRTLAESSRKLDNGNIGYSHSQEDMYYFNEVDFGDYVKAMPPIATSKRNRYEYSYSQFKHLTIGASITVVPSFSNDDNDITSIHLVSPNPPEVRGGFSNRTYLYCKLYVPQGSLNAYKNAPVWKEFFNIEEYESPRLAAFKQKAEQAKAEAERKAKLEAERKAKEEAERKAKAEAERKAKETLNIRVSGDIPPHAYEGTKNYKYIDVQYGVKKIGRAAFKDCKSVTSITLPRSLTEIGDSAFMNCTNLTSITLPKGVKEIGYHAFENCTSLTSITLPNGVTEINPYAFSGCTGLTSITIPDGVTEINLSTFKDCTSLTSITLPNSIREIGYDAFRGCKNLKSITIPDGATKIESGAFWGCINLTSITIPNSVTSIGRCAFYRCSSLNSINIPTSVTKIEDDAFKYCSGLTSLTIPRSVKDIGKYVFRGCSNLNLTLPKKLKSKVYTKECKSVTYYK